MLFLGICGEFVITEYDAEHSSTNFEAKPKIKNILPEFPFKNPADLQLFELDCMMDKILVAQLVNKLFINKKICLMFEFCREVNF